MKGNILLGPAMSGKGRSARLMNRHEKVYSIDGRSNMFKDYDLVWHQGLRHVRKDTTMVLIDDLPGKYFDTLLPYLTDSSLTINNNGKPAEIIDVKFTVIIENLAFWQLPKNYPLFQDYNIYTCLCNNDHNIIMQLHHPEEIDSAYFNKKS